MRATALNYAFLLDQYNNGYTGPGHCSESDPASLSLFNYFDCTILSAGQALTS